MNLAGKNIPGPGSYRSPKDKKKGFYIGIKIEKKAYEASPGPAQYEVKAKITLKSTKGIGIGIEKKTGIELKNLNPGPGAYDQHTNEMNNKIGF